MATEKKIVCLIVDDEPPAREVLKNYIASIPNLELAATCADAVEAFSFLRQQPIDLVFLDIQMPQITGTDFVRTLKNPPKIIFTTAFRKFAVEGFELDAVDYLLKPISFDRFLKAVNKVMDSNLHTMVQQPFHEEKRSQSENGFITFRVDRKNLKVPLDDILYIESLKDYIKVVTKAKNIVTKQSIASLEELLPVDTFIRIHRSFIVAVNKIESYTSELVQIGKQELPISRMYRHEVGKVLKPM